jgi:hypothetical protein
VPVPTVLHRPVLVERVFDDVELPLRLVRQHAPYLPVQRYFANAAEEAVQNAAKSIDESGQRSRERAGGASLTVMPVFRGDWAYDVPLVEGAELVLANERLAEAARSVFGGAVVVPQIVYVNLTTPMPAQPVGHTDIPAFRGVDRTEHPTWLLTMMGMSGLFESHRVRIATAVAWYYDGPGGGFTYWPDGPDAPSARHEPPFSNTAIVGDNDFMFHRVEGIGGDEQRPPRGMTLETELGPAPDEHDTWEIRDDTRVLARYPLHDVRISISWKAKVFRDDEDRRTADEHLDDITLDEVVDRFLVDLAARGTPVTRPDDPATDLDFMATLARTYRRSPSTP